MFETVAPQTFLPRSRRLFLETLPLSVGVHALAAAALVIAGIWQVTFPLVTPHLDAPYSLESIPTPPPPPPPRAAAAKRVTPAQIQPVAQMPEVAPTIIPSSIPVVLPPSAVTPVPVVDGVAGGVEGGVEDGVVGGSVQGVEGGETGGTVGGTLGGLPTYPANTVVVQRDMPLPTAPMSMVFPKYPEEARVRGWEDLVVIRYVIGTDGRVRDVQILRQPEREIFATATLKAVRHWRFRPHVKDGVRQEIVHELSIYFRLEAS